MTDLGGKKDLLLLVADKDMEMAIKGILERPEALGIRKISHDIFSHPRHDPGCCLNSHIFLRPFSTSYFYTIVVFDREGSGKEHKSRQEIETEVEKLLGINGWEAKRARVVVLEPELESWVWSDSPHVRDVIGWKNLNSEIKLRDWLGSQGFFEKDKQVLLRPKEALEAVRRYTKTPKSPALFYQLAKRVSLKNCSDPAFEKLKSVLQAWFSEQVQVHKSE